MTANNRRTLPNPARLIATSHLVIRTEAYDLKFEIKGRLSMEQRRNVARMILRDLCPRFKYIGCIRIYHRDGKNLSFLRNEERYLDENPMVGPTLSTHRGKFGYILRMRRLALGLTQEELARLAGMTRSHLSRLERGQFNPHLYTIRRLEHAISHTLPRLSAKEHKPSPHNRTFTDGQTSCTDQPADCEIAADQIDGKVVFEAMVNPSGISWDTEEPEYDLSPDQRQSNPRAPDPSRVRY